MTIIYHLSSGSPCINAGNPIGDHTGQINLDGETRVMNGRIDIGADEYNYGELSDLAVFCSHWLEQDCNDPSWCEGTDFDHSKTVNFVDFVFFVENWLRGKIPADIDGDSDVDFNDFMKLANHWLDTCVGPTWCEGCDLNQSGRVDFADFALFAQQWLEN